MLEIRNVSTAMPAPAVLTKPVSTKDPLVSITRDLRSAIRHEVHTNATSKVLIAKKAIWNKMQQNSNFSKLCAAYNRKPVDTLPKHHILGNDGKVLRKNCCLTRNGWSTVPASTEVQQAFDMAVQQQKKATIKIAGKLCNAAEKQILDAAIRAKVTVAKNAANAAKDFNFAKVREMSSNVAPKLTLAEADARSTPKTGNILANITPEKANHNKVIEELNKKFAPKLTLAQRVKGSISGAFAGIKVRVTNALARVQSALRTAWSGVKSVSSRVWSKLVSAKNVALRTISDVKNRVLRKISKNAAEKFKVEQEALEKAAEAKRLEQHKSVLKSAAQKGLLRQVAKEAAAKAAAQ